MTTFENLPKEVMINILSRLPSGSVFQFISVSKFWYVLINDPINSSLLQHKHILFMRLQKDSDSEKTQLILYDLALDPSMSLFNDFHLPLPWDWNQSSLPLDWNQSTFPFENDIDFYENFQIHDHCHGLVCLTDYRRNNIVLCNPTTREFCKLPPSIVMLANPSDYIFDGCGNAIGFGYDLKCRDFKVIRIVCYSSNYIYWRAEIFDLSKDRWREVEAPNIFNVDVPNFGIYHEGTIFWMITIEESHIGAIYSFDMSEEVFGQIRLPESVEDKCFQYWSTVDIGVLNGSIAIFHYSFQKNELDQSNREFWKLESALDIWKMERNDECGNVLWSKSFTISLNSKLIGRPLMFMNTNQVLTVKEGQVILYNIKSGQFKELPIKGHADEDDYHTHATYFVESLYSIKGEKY